MSHTKNKDKLGKCLKKKKSWFTLVELIVVITILAILWTIAFISFQNYTKNSRDWVRIADINLLKKNLEIFITEKWFYPAPDNGTNITYDGWLAWTQWTVWDNVITNLARINKKPVDPLTGNEYTYSLANNKVEYQIWAIFELGWELSYILPIIQKANAATTKTATAFVTWTYNEKIIKVSTWSTDYILAVPSIINASLDDTDLQDIITKKQLVYNNYSNIPDSYKNTWYTMTGWFDFVPGSDIVVYSGSMETLWSSWTVQQQFIENLQLVYNETIIQSETQISEILNATTPEQQQILVWSYIDNHVWGLSWNNTVITESNQIIQTVFLDNCTSTGQIYYADNIWNKLASVTNTWIATWELWKTIDDLTCSWHIIMCSWTNSWYTLQACNLWANIVWTWSNSYWYYFQWWNNYGSLAWWPTTITLPNATWYWPNNYYISTAFIIWSSSYRYDWTTAYNNNLWWGITNTNEARKWPCNINYHIPTNLERGDINTVGWWWYTLWTWLSNTLKMPYAGNRNRSNGSIEWLWFGLYWSSSASSNDSSFYFGFVPNSINASSGWYNRARGFPIRCIKNY